jgi:putative MFS transporter
MMPSGQGLSDTVAIPANAGDGGDAPRAALLLARMERIPFSRWHMRARIIMGSATFFDAFNALSLAFVLPILIGLWHITPIQSGWLISSSYIGQLVGALLFSRLAETYGRVPCAAAATAIMSVMSIGCALAGSFWVLFAIRLVQGVGVGGEMPVAATYISELSRAKGRGKFFMLYELIFPVGLMATGQAGAVLVPMFGWKILFLVCGVPGLILAFLLSRLPESPRWLIARDRLDEAEAIIGDAEASAMRKYGVLADPEPSVGQTVAVLPTIRRSRWSELLSLRYRSRTLIAWVLWASAFFVANSLNTWMPTLYKTVYKLDLGDALRAASMTNVAQVAILLVCAFCIDRVGRRFWAVASFLVGGTLIAILALIGHPGVVMVILVATIAYGIIGSINAVLYLYTPEIYPTRMRAVGIGVSTSWLRLASAVGPTLVGLLMNSYGVAAVFWMFAGVAGIGAVAALGMIETSGRKLEDIAP